MGARSLTTLPLPTSPYLWVLSFHLSRFIAELQSAANVARTVGRG
jgi:hypothetical protein